MSDYLLAAIREQPDDDLARLAYADWLEENDQPDRARFVRLQLRAAAFDVRSPEAADLAVQADALAAEHERRWLGEWADRLVTWTFRRGCLDSVTLEPDDFLTDGLRLFTTQAIREVRFVGSNGDPAHGGHAVELVAADAFAHVRAVNASGAWPTAAPDWCRALASARRPLRVEELSLGSAFIPGAIFDDLDAFRVLCETDNLASLKKLDLSTPLAPGSFGDEAAALLLAAPFFRRLEDLSLSGWHLSDDGLRALLTGRPLHLEAFDLSWCEHLTRGGLRSLFESKNLPRLTTLCVGGDVDVSALARSPLLTNLERLDVSTNAARHAREFGPGDWRELATSPNVARLRRLTLLYQLLDEAGARALFQTPGPLRLHSLMLMGGSEAMASILATSPALHNLTALEFVSCGLGPNGVRTLLEAPFVPNLRQFCVAGNPIQSRGLLALLRSPLKAGRLDDLHLHHCELPSGSLRRLFAWPGLANVAKLELGSNALDDAAMQALLASPHLGRLTTLHVGSGRMSEEGLMALARSSALPRLRELTVPSSVGADEIDALQERFGARMKVDSRG